MHPYFKSMIHQLRLHPRLLIAIALAATVASLLPTHLSLVTRLLLSWDVGALLYLLLAVIMFAGATPTHMRARAATQDDGALVVLLLIIIAAIASIVAIIIELAGIKAFSSTLRYLHFGLGIVTLMCSWAFIHTSFALHYAHEYYLSLHRQHQPPLVFPEQPAPNYWDFMYFSFVLGMTSQTSDVGIASSAMRRLALLHGVIAFFFNAALLALAINAAASTL